METKPREWWQSRAATLLAYFQHHAELAGGRWRTNERIARHFVRLLECSELSKADLIALQNMLGTHDVHDGTGWDEFRRMAANWLDESFRGQDPDMLDAYSNGYYSTTDLDFRVTVHDWVVASGELLLITLYHAVPGEKRFRLIRSFETFENFVATLRPRTGLVVFRDRQLPIQGCIDDEFISHVLASIPDGAAWLAVPLSPTLVAGYFQLFPHGAGATAEALLSELLRRRGENIAVGLYPNPQSCDAGVVSAVVPDTDGRALIGIY